MVNCNLCQGKFLRGSLSVHIDVFCDNAPVECTKCKEMIKRHEQGTHDCITALKTKVNVRDEIIKKLIKELKDYNLKVPTDVQR